MTTDTRPFRPLVLPRLVPAGPAIRMAGPGTRFSAGELLDEAELAARLGTLVQLAGRRR